MTLPNAIPDPISDIEESEILRLWHEGFNTYTIAKHLVVPEHVFANRLPELRKRYRMMTGGGHK